VHAWSCVCTASCCHGGGRTRSLNATPYSLIAGIHYRRDSASLACLGHSLSLHSTLHLLNLHARRENVDSFLQLSCEEYRWMSARKERWWSQFSGCRYKEASRGLSWHSQGTDMDVTNLATSASKTLTALLCVYPALYSGKMRIGVTVYAHTCKQYPLACAPRTDPERTTI
jgi:hypothetical protein